MKEYRMPRSEKLTMAELEARAFKHGWTLEPDPDTNLTYAVDARGREVAFAITDTTRPGVSSR